MSSNAVSPVLDFKRNLSGLLSGGEIPLPDAVPLEAFKNAAIVAFTDGADIQHCEPASIYASLRKLGAMGLVPDGNEAALVAYGKTCQAMPMVGGVIKRIRNSALVETLWTEIVFEGERIIAWQEDGARMWEHVESNGDRIDLMSRGGNLIGSYVVCKMKDGSVEFEAMRRDEIENARKASNAPNSPAWKNWYDQMARKTGKGGTRDPPATLSRCAGALALG